MNELMKTYSRWTEEDLNKLRNNWTVPPNIPFLTVLLNRKVSAIYNKAYHLGLPSRGGKRPKRYTQEIRNKCLKTLELYEKYRSFTKACFRTKLIRQTFKNVVSKDKEIHDKYIKIREHISKTFKCRFCKEVFNNEENYMSLENCRCPHKICKECNKLKFDKYFNTLNGKLSMLLGRAKRVSPKSDLTLDFMKQLYEKQDGKCYYTGDILVINSETSRDYDVISLDKKDPYKGYFQNNVVLCK